LEQVQVFPDLADKSIQVQAVFNEIPGNPENYRIKISVYSKSDGKNLPEIVTKLKPSDNKTVTITYPLKDNFNLWDEFNPHLYTLNITLTGNGQSDSRKIDFGMRELSTQGRHIMLNGRMIFYEEPWNVPFFLKQDFRQQM
jgi:hypothetical protein